MELGLSLGEPSASALPSSDKPVTGTTGNHSTMLPLGLDFCMASTNYDINIDPPVQLNLELDPAAPRRLHGYGFPWTSQGMNGSCLDVNRIPDPEADEGSSGSGGGGGGGGEREAASSRASDEEENGMMGRKKLRLSKEQSAFLEESFKEQNNLNPKQKVALAKQLNLRPRQVEVWFQNRRARTKLKQTEVDCDYLKRCCDTLTEENRRLHKELAELRALKTAYPLYAQLPATTLSMCPSCERISSSSSAVSSGPNSNYVICPSAAAAAAAELQKKKNHASFAALFAKPRLFPFGPYPATSHQHQPSAAS